VFHSFALNPQIIAVNTITAAALPSFTHYALIVIVNSIATSITGLRLTTSAKIIVINTVTAPATLLGFTQYAPIIIVNTITTPATGLCLTTSAKVIVVDTAATATAIPGFAQYALIVVIDAVATGKCLTTKTKH
jgi:hypothetical protein